MLRRVAAKERLLKKRYLPQHIATPEEFDRTVDHGILGSLVPEEKFVSKESKIVTLGSCFAANVANDLVSRGYQVNHLSVSERLFNAFALKEFMRGLAAPTTDFSIFESNWEITRGEIDSLKSDISDGAIVIITYGLALVWLDKTTNEMIFDPAQKIGPKLIVEQPDRFEMRITSVEDNFDAMVSTIDAIRQINLNAKIIVTLSPVHSSRAVCDYAGVTADTISKSTLRCALHNLTDLRLKDVFYFPSFEILRWLAPMIDVVFHEDNMLHHIKANWIGYTLSKFRQYYCEGDERPLPPTLSN